jgi:hypothetical protein
MAGTKAGPAGVSVLSFRNPHNYRRISGIQEKSGNPLDTGSRPPQSDSSGMTGSANCDIVSNERGDFFGTKLIGVIGNS